MDLENLLPRRSHLAPRRPTETLARTGTGIATPIDVPNKSADGIGCEPVQSPLAAWGALSLPASRLATVRDRRRRQTERARRAVTRALGCYAQAMLAGATSSLRARPCTGLASGTWFWSSLCVVAAGGRCNSLWRLELRITRCHSPTHEGIKWPWTS